MRTLARLLVLLALTTLALGEINQQLVVFAVDGLTTGASTPRYMPKTHVMADRGLYTAHMRAEHDTADSRVAWDPVFYASSTSERGCDNNGCDSVPRAIDDMPNWVDVLEEDEDFTVSIFSEDKEMLDEVLDRNSLGYAPMARTMEEAVVDYHFPDTPNQLVLIHFSGLNRLGMVSGYESFNYKALVACIDDSIDVMARTLWERCPNCTTFMLMSNHGGRHYEHRSFVIDVIQVPFMLWGHHVAGHLHVDDQSLQTVQIGPTILTVLDAEDSIPEFWIQKAIRDISGPDGVVLSTLPPPAVEEEERADCSIIPISVSHHVISSMNRITIVLTGGAMLVFGAFFFVF